MQINRLLRNITALGVVTIVAASGLGATQAQAQWFGNPYRVKVKVKERGYYPRAVVATPYVPTTYIQAAPVVVSETRVVRPAPVVQRRVIQPAPIIESRVVQPAPIVESRVIQPPAVVESEVIQPAPVIERRMYVAGYPY